jgi:hypothetical protein
MLRSALNYNTTTPPGVAAVRVPLAHQNSVRAQELAANTSSQNSAADMGGAERYRALLEINNAIITNLTHETLLQSVSRIRRPARAKS